MNALKRLERAAEECCGKVQGNNWPMAPSEQDLLQSLAIAQQLGRIALALERLRTIAVKQEARQRRS